MEKKDNHALVLLSGGQDSITCLYWALECFDKVSAISFDYGQKHAYELGSAAVVAEMAGIENIKIIDVKNLLAKSSLIDHSIDHDEKSYLDDHLPASFTPGRNLLFLTIAASYAAENNIRDIVAGFCQTDHDGYPDCRRSTIDAVQRALSRGIGGGDFRIHTPLIYLTKAETWRFAKELGILDIIIDYAITDYNANPKKNDWGYGDENNPASRLRAEGYREAKSKGWI